MAYLLGLVIIWGFIGALRRKSPFRGFIARGKNTVLKYSFPRLIMHHLQHASTDHSCWTCQYWHGETVAGDAHTVCRQHERPTVIGQPDMGCAYWKLDPVKAPELFSWLQGD